MGRFGFAFLVVMFSVAVSLGCASTDWEARYLEKEQESRALQEQYDNLNQSFAERDSVAEGLEQELDKRREELSVLAGQIADLRNVPPPPDPAGNEVERLKAEVARLRAQYPDQPIRVTEEGNIEITLNSEVTFNSGSYELTSQGKKILDSVASELSREFAGHRIMVVGHTDSDPIKKSPFKDNLELGGERAAEVVRYLSKKHRMDDSLLIAASRGSTAPVSDSSTKEGKRKNRRVEIVVVIPRVLILESFTQN